MGTLSDIAAKFKNTLGKISTEAGQIKGAMTDVANKYGQDQGFVGNLGSVVNKGLVGALDIAGGATDFVKSQAQQIADYTPAAYELITTGKAPAGFNPDKQNYYQGGEQIQRGATALSDTVSAKPIANLISEISGPGVISDTAKGAGFILDPYQNIIGNAGSSIEKASKGDKVGAGIALGTSVLSSLPFSRLGTIVGGSIGGSIMGATGANKYLEDTTKQFSEKRTTDLQKEGYSPEEAMARANNEAGGVSLAIMALSQIFGGLKVGGKGTVASTLKKPVNQVTLGDVVKHNLKYGGTSASIQSMEGDVLKYIAGIDSDPDAKKYAGVIAGNFLSGVTPGSFGGAKGKPMSKKGSLSKIAEENAAQTKMDVTPKKIVESAIDATGTKTKKTTLPQINTFSKLADEIGISQNDLYGDSFSKNEKLYRSDQTDDIMRNLRDQRNFNTLRRIDPALMPDDVRSAVEQYKIQGQPGVDLKLRQDSNATKEANMNSAIESGLFKTPDQIVADYVPVEKVNPESAIVTPNKLLSDLAKEQDTALTPVKETALDTTEQITLGDEGARAVPREDTIPMSQELTTTAPDIEMKGGNPPPTVYHSELGNIMNSLGIGKDVFVSKSKTKANEAGSIGGYLEKGMKKVGDTAINLRNLTQSARESAPLFANKILEIAGLDKGNLDLGRKFDIKESDVVGGITPNESTPINTYSQVAGTLKTLIPDSIKNFIGKENVAKTENLAKAEYTYMVNKGNQEKLDSLFSPDEQARFAASEQLSKDVPKEMQQFLLDNDLIKSKQLTDDYVRFVQSEYGRKILSEPVVMDINGKKYRFENIESAMNSAQARRFSGDPKISDSMEAQLASHLKAKGENLDLLRVHSPSVQLISYAQSIGNMLQNKATIDNFRQFMQRDENKNIKDPQAFEFIAKLFPEQGQSEILSNMIHVYGRENTTSGMVKEKIADATRRSSAAILALNLHTLIQPFYSTIPKGLMLKAAKSKFGFGTHVDILDKNSTQTNEILSANGFVSPMEQFDTSNATKASKLLSEIAAESSGRSSEQAAKKLYVLADMAEVLKRNGVTDVSSKPLEIAQAWEKWARDPKNKDQYLIEQNRIHDNLGWMGESNIMNKSMFDIVRKTNLQALQGYSNSQVNKAMTDFGKVVGYIEASGDQKKAAAARSIAGILPYAATAGAVFTYLQSQNPDADPAELFDLSLSAANKMSGNVFSQAYALLSGQTSTPITTIIPIATDLLGMIVSGISQDGTFTQRADKLVTDVNKSIGGLTALNEVTGGGYKQAVSDMLGTANTEDLTRTGKARGSAIGSLREGLERTVGLNTDTLVSNYMYGKISDAEFAKKVGVEDPSLSYILTKTVGAVQGLKDGLVRPITDFIGGVTGETDKIDYGTLTNINTVYGKLSPEDTTESYLAKLGVSKDLASVVNSEIQKLFESEAGNTAGLGTANKLGGIISETPGYTTNSQAPLGKRLEEIRVKNPKLFNDIVSSFGKLYGMNQTGTIPVDVRNIDTIKKDIFKNSSMQEDAAISAVTGDNPNSTALSQSITNAYQDISKDDTTLEQKVKSLKVLDGIFSGVYNAGAIAQGIERSIALESFKLLDSLKNEMKYTGLKGVQDIIAATPNILKAIKNGLTYRGFTTIPTQGTPTAQPASQTTAPAQGSLSAIASSMYGKKQPKWTNAKYTPAKIEPLIKSSKTMSLSDLAKSQSSKSPMKSGQRTK